MFTFSHSVRTAANLREGAILCQHASSTGRQLDIGTKDTDVGIMALVGDTSTLQGDFLRTLVWKNQAGVMVAIAGISGSEQAFDFLRGSRNPINVRDISGRVNAFVARKAEAIFDYVTAIVNPTPTQIAFFGHSAGGAVAHLLSAMYSVRHPTPVNHCANYGQPRFADAIFNNFHRAQCQARVMNFGDAFCLLVPHSNESAAWSLMSNPADLGRINTLEDSDQGIAITSTFELQDSSLPIGASILTPGTMLTAWSSPSSSVRVAHAIASYVDALTSRAITTPDALPTRGVVLAPDTRPNSLPSQASIAMAQVQALAAMQAAHPGTGTPPRRSFIRYQRAGRLWVVTAGGTTVYVASTKNDARAVARVLRGLYIQFWQRPFAFVTPEMLSILVLSTPPNVIPAGT